MAYSFLNYLAASEFLLTFVSFNNFIFVTDFILLLQLFLTAIPNNLLGVFTFKTTYIFLLLPTETTSMNNWWSLL